MSDPQSGIISKQERQILRESENETAKEKGHDYISELKNRSSLYNLGIEIMEGLGYRLKLSETGTFCYHDFYKSSDLRGEIKGISYPREFKPFVKLVDIDEVYGLWDAFTEEANDEELLTFWLPLLCKPQNVSPLEAYAKNKLSLDKQAFITSVKRDDVLDLHHAFYYGVRTVKDEYYETPLTWVPASAWFAPNIRKLKFNDIFTLLPPAELELFKLMLGRIGVGISGHNPPGTDIVVDHTYRMAGILVGRQAGLGKSTMMEAFISAIAHCGFSTATFRDITTQFGLKEAAMSHLLYKDDTTIKTLAKILTSEETKILVSNGLLQSEEKFQSKEEIKSRCVLIASSNDWDNNLVYNLDSGIISRVKLLSTYYGSELERLNPYVEAVGKSSEDLRPHYHLKWLAKELDCDLEAIMLWGLRLATDRFWEVITDDSKPGTNPLEIEVRKWTSRCRIRFKADSTQALINAIIISLVIKNAENVWEFPELTPEVLAEGLSALYYLMTDLSATGLIDIMKEQWEGRDRPTTHYYSGLREIRPESLKDASLTYNSFVNEQSTNKTSIPDMVKTIMSKITLRDGFKVSPGMTYLIEFWSRAQFNLEELKESAIEVLTEFETEYPQEFQCMLDNWKNGPTDDWIGDPNYTPKNAERLKVQYLTTDPQYLKRIKNYVQ